jgi:hypothetical protein
MQSCRSVGRGRFLSCAELTSFTKGVERQRSRVGFVASSVLRTNRVGLVLSVRFLLVGHDASHNRKFNGAMPMAGTPLRTKTAVQGEPVEPRFSLKPQVSLLPLSGARLPRLRLASTSTQMLSGPLLQPVELPRYAALGR